MRYLFGSEIPTLAFRFRDYIRAQFNVEVELRDIQDENGQQIQLFYLNMHRTLKLSLRKYRFFSQTLFILNMNRQVGNVEIRSQPRPH